MKPAPFSCRCLPDGITFASQQAARLRILYFPLCGPDSQGIKSSITPFLSGDIKIDKNRYLTKPVSRLDLLQDTRNFFVFIPGKGVFALNQDSVGSSAVIEAGMLWHKIVRRHPSAGLELQAVNFVPASGETVELMRVTVKNISRSSVRFTPTASIPVFGRALANKHDHEHVTSLLHRVEQRREGVLVAPVMVFDERGHKANAQVYYVTGKDSQGRWPAGAFPTVENFCGEGGTIVCPEAVWKNRRPGVLSPEARHGREAMGALRFGRVTLKPGDRVEYFIVIGTASHREDFERAAGRFCSAAQFDAALARNKEFWAKKAQAIAFKTGNAAWDFWMHWVTIQPVLRRIFGCSFLPDHDYGKGGRGWRDIWQDLLSLILIEPENIRETLIQNFAGVRMDGSNATIIGSVPGEFIADRNAIARVWMDHGVWPWLTVLLYVQQTGDYKILLEENAYFRDPQLSRTFEKDIQWTADYGNQLKSSNGHIVKGTILEHLLVQHLVQFFNVGEHNITRLESADWNDGLDMAFQRGESVTFMSLYGGNLLAMADLLEGFARRDNIKTLRLAKELLILLDRLGTDPCDYEDPKAKRRLLFERYFQAVQPEISGEKIDTAVEDLIADLRGKGKWIFAHIARQEKVRVQDGQRSFAWFNGYYDNQGRAVEGKKGRGIWMTLTGQVFPILSGMASNEDITETIKSVERFLRDKRLGGYRLNTDFGLPHYLDLGRAFGFACGAKENGAFFSHMTVMYACALYKRGFVREGYEVLNSIYLMCSDTARSRIYPGIPEYFDSLGRGMYPYLTGSASWLVLTQLTQVFGIRGEGGDLILAPQLVKEEFGRKNQIEVRCSFAGRPLTVCYLNEKRLDYGRYGIQEVSSQGNILFSSPAPVGQVKIRREQLLKLNEAALFVKLVKS